VENKSLIVTVPNSFVSATLGEISDDVDLVEWDMTGRRRCNESTS